MNKIPTFIFVFCLVALVSCSKKASKDITLHEAIIGRWYYVYYDYDKVKGYIEFWDDGTYSIMNADSLWLLEGKYKVIDDRDGVEISLYNYVQSFSFVPSRHPFFSHALLNSWEGVEFIKPKKLTYSILLPSIPAALILIWLLVEAAQIEGIGRRFIFLLAHSMVILISTSCIYFVWQESIKLGIGLTIGAYLGILVLSLIYLNDDNFLNRASYFIFGSKGAANAFLLLYICIMMINLFCVYNLGPSLYRNLTAPKDIVQIASKAHLQRLESFTELQSTRLRTINDSIKVLMKKRENLMKLARIDTASAKALIDEIEKRKQEQARVENIWKEQGIAFAMGIITSMLASILLKWLYKSKINHEVE